MDGGMIAWIDDSQVTAVLLAGGWIRVRLHTFETVAYNAEEMGLSPPSDPGQADAVVWMEALWDGEDGIHYQAPLASILAVQCGRARR